MKTILVLAILCVTLTLLSAREIRRGQGQTSERDEAKGPGDGGQRESRRGKDKIEPDEDAEREGREENEIGDEQVNTLGGNAPKSDRPEGLEGRQFERRGPKKDKAENSQTDNGEENENGKEAAKKKQGFDGQPNDREGTRGNRIRSREKREDPQGNELADEETNTPRDNPFETKLPEDSEKRPLGRRRQQGYKEDDSQADKGTENQDDTQRGQKMQRFGGKRNGGKGQKENKPDTDNRPEIAERVGDRDGSAEDSQRDLLKGRGKPPKKSS